MEYFVYILKSLSSGNFYKGLTNNVNRRLDQHFKGLSPTTKHQLPLVLIHAEICDSRIEARKLDRYFKSGAGREIIKEIDAGVVKWYTQGP